MNLDEALTEVAVLGAAGKMGSGISLLLLQEMARLEARSTGKLGSGKYRLLLIDANSGGLDELRKYLKTQIQKYAEKNIVALRKEFSNNKSLISNEEIIEYFVAGTLDLIHLRTMPEEAKNAKLIFEAIVEDVDIKAKVFNAISSTSTKKPYFFTNTSSIPISVLNEKAGLNGNIIGYHFYNPPAIQKLLEIIPLERGDHALFNIAKELAARLEKTVVVSRDVPGFIGNGYFLREINFACSVVARLAEKHPLYEATYMVNKVTQEYLLRPMGIFQLLDYVGLDVGQKIGKIMDKYLSEDFFNDDLIGAMLKEGITGGQFPDGSQKNGFFQYTKHQISGIYVFDEKRYKPMDEGSWKSECDKALGPMPPNLPTWKGLQKDPKKDEKIKAYFESLAKENTLGAELAKEFISHLFEIAQGLVDDGVAEDLSDVEKVLVNGFFHLYGPNKELVKT